MECFYLASTIRDVAKAANVSVSTVSLVLRGKECRISSSTRQRILEAAERLHYIPNQIAVSLVTKKTRTIGLIYSDMLNPFYAELAVGLERSAQTRGYSLLICNCDNNVERCIQNINLLQSRCIDGFVLQPPATINANPEHLKALHRQLQSCSIPYTILDCAIHDVFHDYVAADHRLGGQLVAEYLLSLGHRNIGCITGNVSDYATQHRLEGFRKVLTAHNVSFTEDQVYHGQYLIESGYLGANALFQKNVTAIFAFSDLIAIGVQKAASERKKSIPQELSLVGYNDSLYANLCSVPLTTIHQPIELLGNRSFEILMERIQNPNREHQDYLYPPALIQRASCSVPRPSHIPLLP